MINPAIHTCVIALGSNLGNSPAILEAALEALDQRTEIQVSARSPWYRTKAVGPPQPDYCNGCALLQITLSPLQLLAELQAVETQFGRVRQERWGPRTLDLDLLFYDDLILAVPNLQVPHPRLRERAFVLVPLATITPNWIDPVTKTAIADLVQAVDCSGVRLW